MTRHARLAGAFIVVWLTAPALPARAEPMLLAPGDVLRATFDMRWFTQPSGSAYDVFIFIPGVQIVEPISSYTTRLIDRGSLLGTYTGPPSAPGAEPLFSPFVGATSTYTRGNPTLIDFSSLVDGTFDGWVEFSIGSGLVKLFRASDELEIGLALTPDIESGNGFMPATYEILRAQPEPNPVPEPSGLLLVSAGGLALLRRRKRQRDRNHGVCL